MVGRPVFATSIPATQELPDFQYLIGKDEPPESVAARIRKWASTDAAHALRVRTRQDFTWSGIFARKILPFVTAIAHRPVGVQP